ncbi:MAG: NlpC/P60 family protein [Lachnospiraceae bacterium]|nr:NlpC/P60 family protein [Lachnospiraceae bacterium]
MKKILALILAASMIVTVPAYTPTVTAQATSKKVKNLQKKQQKTQAEVDSLQSKLVDIISQIDGLESDIKSNAQDIEDTKEEVKEAKKAEKQQYKAMKSRIRYFYENDTDNNVFNILVGSKSLTDFINKVSYMNSVYSYDRDLLDSYEATRVEIQGMEEDLEDKQIELKKEKQQLKSNKASLNSLIDSKKGEVADIQKQVTKAKKEAARKAAEKAAALERERQARNAAAAAAAARRSARRVNSGGGSSSNSSAYTQDADPSPATSVSGGAVVSYANQFVGNPYVWGGNSLTNGCDCSGFVVQVYRHFGINLSGSRNSAALRSVGQAVSPGNIKAGDIVCYPGHVAIYSGNGCIVEAQSSRAGITNNRAWNHGTVLAIRRVI